MTKHFIRLGVILGLILLGAIVDICTSGECTTTAELGQSHRRCGTGAAIAPEVK